MMSENYYEKLKKEILKEPFLNKEDEKKFNLNILEWKEFNKSKEFKLNEIPIWKK
jgi:hypothetical protein